MDDIAKHQTIELAFEELESLDTPGWGFWAGIAIGIGVGVIIT